MNKPKLCLAAILSTSAMPMAVCVATLASGVLLGSVNSAQACGHFKSDLAQERYDEQINWLRTPLALIITIPGIALATALSIGHRSYNR